MDRKILFRPYREGLNSLGILFMVIGEKGIVEFDLMSRWLPTSLWEETNKEKRDRMFRIPNDKLFLLELYLNPFPADVCYWSLVRISEDDTEMEGISRIYDGARVFYGYTYDPHPREVYDALVSEGEEKVWELLEGYYREVFGNDEALV